MDERIKKYKPHKLWSGKSRFIKTVGAPSSTIETIIIKENTSGLIIELIVVAISIVFSLVFVVKGTATENTVLKIIGIGLGLFVLVAGIGLGPETIKRLKYSSQRARLTIDRSGIRFQNTLPSEMGNYNWKVIREITIKIFPDRSQTLEYLLFITEQDMLVAINLTLLRMGSMKLDKNDKWHNTSNRNYLSEIAGCIQHHFKGINPNNYAP